MTLGEYNKKMNEYDSRLSSTYGTEWGSLYKEVSEFQHDYMTDILDKYKSSIDNEAKRYIYDLFSYAVKTSRSGSSIVYVDTKELADDIESILWEEIGDYLLDYKVYEENNRWAIDCVFAGFYVPYWDGWCKE